MFFAHLIKLSLFIFIILFIFSQDVSALIINEIMYNPSGNDNNNEYLEIIVNQSLEGFTVQDSYSSDILQSLQLINSSYSIIVEEGFDYSGINASVYSAGATIGNNLNNDEDYILIKNGTEVLDVIHYYDYWGANGNGKSVCKFPNEIGRWKECEQTPGKENSEGMSNYTITISEFLPDPQGNDDAFMPDGEWIELFNHGEYELDLSEFELKDDFGHSIIISSTTTYNQTVKPKDYLVVYSNGFSGFLNNEGFEKIKIYSPSQKLIEEVSYSGSEEGSSWSKVENAWIITKPSPDKENYKEDEEKESTIEIEEVYLGENEKAKFGDNIRVKIRIYKGNSTKESIEAYIEDNKERVSKVTRFNILEKYSETKITIPIQIFPNCNLKREEGSYDLIIEGLDTKFKKEIQIEGITDNLCEKQKTQQKSVIKNSSSKNKLSSENVINPPEKAITTNQLMYQSSSEKTGRSAVYFLSLALILLLVKSIKKWHK